MYNTNSKFVTSPRAVKTSQGWANENQPLRGECRVGTIGRRNAARWTNSTWVCNIPTSSSRISTFLKVGTQR